MINPIHTWSCAANTSPEHSPCQHVPMYQANCRSNTHTSYNSHGVPPLPNMCSFPFRLFALSGHSQNKRHENRHTKDQPLPPPCPSPPSSLPSPPPCPNPQRARPAAGSPGAAAASGAFGSGQLSSWEPPGGGGGAAARRHTHTCVCTVTYVRTYVRTCTRTYIHRYIHAYIRTLLVCLYLHMYTCARVSVSV